MERVLVICNPFAGGGTSIHKFENFKKFAANSAHEFEFYLTQHPGDYGGIAQAIAVFNPTVVSMVGGDGTVNEVLNVPEVHQRKVHIVPAGSGNDFQRLVYGNIDEQTVYEKSVSKTTASYDLGVCNGRFFLNGVGIGFDGSVARQTVRMKLPFIASSWKYWIAIFKNVLFYKSKPITIIAEDLELTDRLFMVAVANGTDYGGGFKISPWSKADDGVFDLVLLHKMHPLKRLLKIPQVKAGKHGEADFT